MTAPAFPAWLTMALLPLCGMAVGLAIDTSVTPPALIAALCAAPGFSPAAALRFHATVMPASYVMMAAGGLAALGLLAGTGEPRRLAAGAVGIIVMLCGMAAGGWLAPELAALLGVAPDFTMLVAAMTAGMLVAALAGPAVARAMRSCGRLRRSGSAQYIMYQ